MRGNARVTARTTLRTAVTAVRRRLVAGPDVGGLAAGLVERSHLLTPSDLAGAVADQARLIHADEVVVYLIDYSQTVLVPLPSPAAPDRTEVPVDGTMAGRAFRTFSILEGDGTSPGRRRLWLPLLDGTDRLGVLEMTFAGSRELRSRVLDAGEAYAGLVSQLIISQRQCGDVFEFVRRRQPLALAAEMQWRLLPPLSFATDNLVIAASLEPWQEVGGDTFDYAVNGETAHLAVFDAMGHGVGATMLASVAVGAYRNARRALLDLEQTYLRLDAALTEHFDGEKFVTALLAELDVETGRLRWVSAGHPPPLLLRRGKLIGRLELPPSPPLGLPFPAEPPVVGEESLEPGDRLICYTDGVIEARSARGDFFGIERLGEFVVRQSASGQPAPEILRRLSRAILDHQLEQLQDDATTLLLEWRRGTERSMLPARNVRRRNGGSAAPNGPGTPDAPRAPGGAAASGKAAAPRRPARGTGGSAGDVQAP